MKTLKKITAAALSVSLLAMVGCSQSGSGGENSQPFIDGVTDMSIEAGSEFDALAGITASDPEDGDLTPKIVISSTPELSFSGGKATPEKAGSYELTYSVTDKDGLTAEGYATLTVTRQTGEAVVYKDFDFDTPQTADSKGWNVNVGGSASASGELSDGAYVINISDPGSGDGDVQFIKSGIPLKAADYRIKVWAKSTADTYAHIIVRDENAEEWTAFGGTYNAVIGQEVSPAVLEFTSSGEGSAELMINLGRITPNPENPSDTSPDSCTVTVDKIEIYEISGNETKNPVYENDFSADSENAVSVSAGDGSAASAAVKDDAAEISIESYPTSGGVWSIKGDIALPGISVEEGKKYYYSFKISSQYDQSGECLVESASQGDAARVNFDGLSLAAGEEKTVTGTFTADKAVSDPVIRMQIGNPSDGVTANIITVDDVSFGTMEGDLKTVKTIDAFTPFGAGTANETNAEYPFSTFNGTDEDNEKGVGTIWTDGGSFFYHIDQGGTVDWHNKLIIGYNENPLVLEGDSYYTVEITAKATKDVSCGFFLNPLGGWDPRISEQIDFTTEEQIFTFDTTDTFIADMNFEMLFQFGSEQTAQLGEVTVEFTDIKIMQKKVN